MRELLSRHGIAQYEAEIARTILPAIGFSFEESTQRATAPASKLGGHAWVPPTFEWPTRGNRTLDFLLQIDLSTTAQFPVAAALPQTGLLAFFYDLKEQPWGFDPNDLDSFGVFYFPNKHDLVPQDSPDAEYRMPEYPISFFNLQTVPHWRSRAAKRLAQEFDLTREEWEAFYTAYFCGFCDEFEGSFRPNKRAGNHHLFGHSGNIQGDMQLEAQLVTNGLYCGNESGYRDPKAKTLEPGADDWLLLLQLDSDDTIDIMWGDCGMLYYWVPRQDLAKRDFGGVWMGLQCY